MNTITREKHFHIMEGNNIVFHIHPVDKSSDQPFGNHSHSAYEHIDLQCNLLDFQESSPSPYWQETPVINDRKFYPYDSPYLLKISLSLQSLRAPPLMLS